MREFFKGWRRKAGIVTLVTALMFVSAWVRSLTFIEGVSIPLGMKQSASLVSIDSSLVWLTQRGDQSFLFPQFTSRRFSDFDDRVFENPFFEWRWKSCGFGFGVSIDGTKQVGNQMIQMTPGTLAVIPFWPITASLTLLAAYLLLAKTRVARPTNVSEK